VIIISRNAINVASPVVIAVPCTTFRGQHIYPSQVLIHSPEGGLTADSLAKTDQISTLSKTRLTHRYGLVTAETLSRIEDALLKAVDIRRP
jgi:mRNA interferase MazF